MLLRGEGCKTESWVKSAVSCVSQYRIYLVIYFVKIKEKDVTLADHKKNETNLEANKKNMHAHVHEYDIVDMWMDFQILNIVGLFENVI